MPSIATGLLTAAALVGAQAGFKDPGPPPAQAAPVPTLDQAKIFVESMASRYGSVSCTIDRKLSGQSVDTQEYTTLVSLDGNTIKIEDRFRRALTRDEGVSNFDDKETVTFSLSDVTFKVSSGQLDPSLCVRPVRIEFLCASQPCVDEQMVSVELPFERTPSQRKYTVVRAYASLYLRDSAIAERLVKALQFLKDNAKVVERSPF